MHGTNASAAVDPRPGGQADGLLIDCLRGLDQPQKALPCKWLYDAEGSRLFERICATPEYYPSRTEAALLAEAAPALARALAPDTALVEFGSGASRKTRLILDAAPAISAYVPIDISAAELAAAATAIARDYPGLRLLPIQGDFTRAMTLDPSLGRQPRLGFFPGSTIGNFAPEAAVAFLGSAREMLGRGSRLLLGADLAKDEDVLLAAYDDAGGVTAAFNRNLLVRLNRELDCLFDLATFDHRAVWNPARSRIEMHLVSSIDQHVVIAHRIFAFAAGESIHTENSHKFTLAELAAMCAEAGWRIQVRWISEDPSYALLLLGS